MYRILDFFCDFHIESAFFLPSSVFLSDRRPKKRKTFLIPLLYVLLLGFKLSCGKSVKYRYIEFFAFDYDSLPISFQSGIAVSFSSS